MAITTETMLKAAELGARARQTGNPTAADTALDADVIFAAQGLLLIEDGEEVVIATANPKHLSLFVPAACSCWQGIG